MDDFINADMDFFTEESYQEYLNQQSSRHNDRLREKDETIFDALLSDEANFMNTPQGQEIIATIRGYK